jgi:hypothetical protein
VKKQNWPARCHSPGEDQGERVLGHGVDGVAAHVGDHDPALPAGARVDHVVAGRGHGDHLQIRQLRERRLTDRYLVGDRDGRVRKARDDLVAWRGVVLAPLVLEARPAQLDRRPDRRAIEKDDALHGALRSAPTASCRRPYPATTSWRCSPRPSMPRCMTLPGLRNTGSGLTPMPTPGGVPVLMTSPGSSVM